MPDTINKKTVCKYCGKESVFWKQIKRKGELKWILLEMEKIPIVFVKDNNSVGQFISGHRPHMDNCSKKPEDKNG